MSREKVSDDEILDLAIEMAGKYPHLREDTHLTIVQAGYANYFGKKHFREWYEETIPLLTQRMVNCEEDISYILMYDSHIAPELGIKSLCELLQKRDAA